MPLQVEEKLETAKPKAEAKGKSKLEAAKKKKAAPVRRQNSSRSGR